MVFNVDRPAGLARGTVTVGGAGIRRRAAAASRRRDGEDIDAVDVVGRRSPPAGPGYQQPVITKGSHLVAEILVVSRRQDVISVQVNRDQLPRILARYIEHRIVEKYLSIAFPGVFHRQGSAHRDKAVDHGQRAAESARWSCRLTVKAARWQRRLQAATGATGAFRIVGGATAPG